MNENMSSEKMIMPIGKYKGQPIEAIQHDKKYFDWLCQQSWFREKYGDTYQIIINNFQEPTETPEHNQLQAMFLSAEFQKNILSYIIDDRFYETKEMIDFIKILNKNTRNKIERKEYLKLLGKNIVDKKKRIQPQIIDVKFEEDGFDVIITYRFKDHTRSFILYDNFVEDWYSMGINDFYKKINRFAKEYEYKNIAIEIKPNLSDDYPAILRQIKNNSCEKDYKILIYDKFSAIGASIEQVKKIFASSGINVLSFADILGHEVL